MLSHTSTMIACVPSILSEEFILRPRATEERLHRDGGTGPGLGGRAGLN